MPRSSTVSEKVWAQAIHAVTVQKMSLRRAAQLYGVHHMSLHRRVRGRYMTSQASRFEDDFGLTAAEEAEVVSVLREQFFHEGHVSADDVRYVVRTIASQDGLREIPSDFPLNRWISNFKRVHGLVSPKAATESSMVSSFTRQLQIPSAPQPSSSSQRRAVLPPVPPAPPPPSQSQPTGPSQYRTPTGVSSTPGYTSRNNDMDQRDSTSESESEHHCETREREARMVEAKRTTTTQSNAIPQEIWEKAIDAVEIHGMSLRNAAKAYGVHFAALHRRVKKRALKKDSAPPLENYIPFEDEAGIVRVIHARADLGILMTFEELVDLLNRTAMKYGMLSPEMGRAVVRRFQSRVEQSIRHLVKDWPLPRLDALYRFHGSDSEEKGGSPGSPPNRVQQLPSLYPPLPSRFGHHDTYMTSEPKSNGGSSYEDRLNSSPPLASTYNRPMYVAEFNGAPKDRAESSPMAPSILRL